MIYSFKSRIRYSETDSEGNLTFPALLDYFQDTSTFHGEDNDLTLKDMYESNLTWILGAWQVRLYKKARLADHITFYTWAYKFSHCLGFRHYKVTDDKGEPIAVADTQVVLMNFDTMTPVDINDRIVKSYTLEEDSHIDLKLSRKIRPAKGFTSSEPIVVQPYMIDTNGHVNNAQYIKTAMTLLPKGFEFNCFRCEYKKQAHLNDTFYPRYSKLENGVQICLYDEDNSLFFIGEWTADTDTVC